MENKDYRKSIGEKLEAALREGDFEDLEDLIEMPSRETFDKWVEEADERRQLKFKKKKALSWCAVLLVGFLIAAFAIAIKGFAVPNVEADPEQERTIDNSMETTATYESWADLPSDIKEQFFEFTAFPEGYEVEEVCVEERLTFTKIIIVAKQGEELIKVRQTAYTDDVLDSNLVTVSNDVDVWYGVEVYIESHTDKLQSTTYNFVSNNVLVDVTTDNEIEVENVKKLIKEAVQ